MKCDKCGKKFEEKQEVVVEVPDSIFNDRNEWTEYSFCSIDCAVNELIKLQTADRVKDKINNKVMKNV